MYFNKDYESDDEYNNMTEKFEKVGSKMSIDSSDHEVQEKMAIILSIKVEEMQKKIKILTN